MNDYNLTPPEYKLTPEEEYEYWIENSKICDISCKSIFLDDFYKIEVIDLKTGKLVEILYCLVDYYDENLFLDDGFELKLTLFKKNTTAFYEECWMD